MVVIRGKAVRPTLCRTLRFAPAGGIAMLRVCKALLDPVGGRLRSGAQFGIFCGLMVLAVSLVASRPAEANACQTTCDAEYKACQAAFCTPMKSGCAYWCSLIYTIVNNGCVKTCPVDGGRCLTDAHGDVLACWRTCWPVVKGGGSGDACMQSCSDRHSQAAEACKSGASPPASTPVPPSTQGPATPPSQPVGPTGPGGDWPTYIASGQPFRLVLDGTAGKFDDSRYSGNYRTDPLGTIRGGETYVLVWRNGVYQGTGFNQGTNQQGTWSNGGGNPTAGTFNLWGVPFRFTDTGQVIHDRWGVVGHLEKGGASHGRPTGEIARIVAHLRAGRPVLIDLDHTRRHFDDSTYSGNYRTDPLGTLKGGEQYVVFLRPDGFETTGFNQGTGGFGRWGGYAAAVENGEVSLWGITVTLESNGAVGHPQYGRVGTLYGP